MIAKTSIRVRHHDSPAVVDKVRRRLSMSIAYHRQHPQEIDHRLRELDEEWDVERALETAASAISLTGLVLTVFKNRKFLLVPLVVQGFFLQHALEGWCPPLPVLRRLGFRTADEINRERYALKAIRGDFANFESSDADEQPAALNL